MKRARPTKLVIVAVAALLIGSGNASLLSLRRSATLQSAILDRLTTSDYAGLVLLARDPSNQWDKVALPDESLAKVDPKIFAEMPWLSGHMDPNGLFAVIERQYPLYVSSRPLFGAISFALEEVLVAESLGFSAARSCPRPHPDRASCFYRVSLEKGA